MLEFFGGAIAGPFIVVYLLVVLVMLIGLVWLIVRQRTMSGLGPDSDTASAPEGGRKAPASESNPAASKA